MLNQHQMASKQAQATTPKAPAPTAPASMQLLNAEELRAVAGGPVIQNGGASTG